MAASDVNICIFTGTVVADAEIRYTSSGTAVAHFRLANTWRGYDSKNDKPQDRTTFIRCVIWDKLAERLAPKLLKAQRLFLSGHFSTSKYKDKDGKDQWGWEFVVEKLQFCYKKLEDIEPPEVPDKEIDDGERVPF